MESVADFTERLDRVKDKVIARRAFLPRFADEISDFSMSLWLIPGLAGMQKEIVAIREELAEFNMAVQGGSIAPNVLPRLESLRTSISGPAELRNKANNVFLLVNYGLSRDFFQLEALRGSCGSSNYSERGASRRKPNGVGAL